MTLVTVLEALTTSLRRAGKHRPDAKDGVTLEDMDVSAVREALSPGELGHLLAVASVW